MGIEAKKIKIPIYTGTLKIYFFESKQDWNKLCKKYNCDLSFDDFAAIAFHDKQKNSYVVFLNANLQPKDYDYIAHETTHIVNRIFDSHMIKLDIHNDEPQTYLTGWVFKQLCDSLIEYQKEKDIKSKIKESKHLILDIEEPEIDEISGQKIFKLIWNKTEDIIPPENEFPLIGYNKEWIDEIQNPKGIRLFWKTKNGYESQIPTLKVDVKNFFDYDSIPEYWTVLNICY